MRIKLLIAFLTISLLSACGGGSNTTVGNTTYDRPATLVTPAADKHLGGSVQASPLGTLTTVSTIAGITPAQSTLPISPTPGLQNGEGAAARFYQPNGMASDGSHLYIADYKNNVIRKISLTDGKYTVTLLAGNLGRAAGYDDSTGSDGTTATFNGPTGVTVAGKYLYVADSANNMIRRVDKVTGETHLLAGSTTGLAAAVDSTTLSTDARFNMPLGITTDGAALYVTDYGNQTVRRIVIPPDTTATADITKVAAVTTLAGAPTAAGNIDAPLGKDARFNFPAGLTTDGTYLYVTDSLNRTIRKIDLATTNVTTIAGISGPLDVNGNIADSSDGTGATARFNLPNGITTDGVNLYVTDTYNYTIRKIILANGAGKQYSGAVSTITPNFGTEVTFHAPIGITTDGTALYIADTLNHTIRMIK